MLLSISKLKIMVMVLTIGTTLVAEIKQDFKHIKCEIRPRARTSVRKPHPRMPFLGKRKKNATASSTNWSGYVAATNLANPARYSVTQVSGSWIVPNLQSSPVDTSASIWVGIDGSGSPTVEQLGTEHDVTSGKQSHYAWYEMYPQGSNEIVGFPVNVGDSISASVTYIALNGVIPASSDLFILQLVNNTRRMYTYIPYITNVKMERLCAEWIVEAPYLNAILPLSNFGTVFVSNCSAVIGNIDGSISSSAWVNESMDMVSPAGVAKAATSALSADGKSFSVVWKSN